MMDISNPYVGIVTCSGEEIPEGTTTRLAFRKVREQLRPGQAVTICLPLFIAGGEEERQFAISHPTITLDGCEKRCAAMGTEKLSGKPAKCLVVTEILKEKGIPRPTKVRRLGAADKAAADVVADELAKAIDEVLGKAK